MTVNVADGSARVSTGTYPTSYGYFVAVDTTNGESVTITTADPVNPRIDVIVGYVDVAVTASSVTPNNPNNMLKLAAVAGTPAGSPAVPNNAAIQSAIGAANPYVILANVAVGATVTTILNANITDKRTFATIGTLNASAPWQSYTPTVTLNGGGSNGNATITGGYIQIGKTVHFYANYLIGSTTTFSGLTSLYLTIPVASASPFTANTTGSWATGEAIISGTTFLLNTAVVNSTTIQLVSLLASGSYLSADVVTATKPGSWVVGSSWFVSGSYQAA